jgi:hypothetical protein
MNWKSTAVVSGATVLATWLGWTSTPPHAGVGQATVPPVRDVRPIGDADIQAQAEKLEHRVRGEVEYQNPTRNPFVFGARRPVTRPGRPVPDSAPSIATAPSPPAVVPPALTLAGIAVDGVAATQRTAIIETASGVAFVKEGDRLGSYTVAQVTDSSAELVDADGTPRTLTLKP